MTPALITYEVILDSVGDPDFPFCILRVRHRPQRKDGAPSRSLKGRFTTAETAIENAHRLAANYARQHGGNPKVVTP